MKSLISLWCVLANEFAGRCSTSTTMDINNVRGRVKHEGMSFLTITLPSFGKDFQFCLDQGMIVPSAFSSFKKSGPWLPAFLRGFTGQVFDPCTGVLFDDPSVECIQAIRQLTLLFGKMHLPCTPERERKAMDEYVKCDREVAHVYENLHKSDIDDFCRISHLLFRDVFSGVDSDIYNSRIVPRHGPGAVADRLTSNGKFNSTYWTSRLDKVFPVWDFLFPSPRFVDEELGGVTILEPDAELPVRVVTVPKTQKAPRIIAIEPSSVQFVQQGLLESITAHTQRSFVSGFISSESQLPNQQLAQKGSSDRSLATLDLSEASDRVPFELVRELTTRHPMTFMAVSACRSQRASVPGHGVIPLSKFASMGSALCFPFEAMVFLSIIFLGIEREQGHRFERKGDFLPFLSKVRVYGDDIVVPVEYVHTVIDHLELFGAKVGHHKSFWTGGFRESCGKEYYDGHDVSIVKVRRKFPLKRQQIEETQSLVSLRNQLYLAGAWKTVTWLDLVIGDLLCKFPIVEPTSPGIGRTSFLGYNAEKMCEHLHRPLVKAYVVSSKPPRDSLDGQGALLKFHLKRGSLPSDVGHLERAGRPRSAYIKLRWVTPY